VNGLKVAAVQMDAVLGKPEANWETAEALVAGAASAGARVVVLPELFATGYRLDEDYGRYAETVPGPTTARLEAWCAGHKLEVVVGTVIEESSERGQAAARGAPRITAVAVGRDGLLGAYGKMNLWDRERLYFEPGSGPVVCSTPVGPIGLLICYDLGFPEMARSLALLGADIVCAPAAFGAPRLYAWDLSTRSRALENGFFIIAANRVGQEKDSVFAGHSRIVAPDGGILAEIPLGAGAATAELNLEAIATQRAALPYLRDLRPEYLPSARAKAIR